MTHLRGSKAANDPILSPTRKVGKYLPSMDALSSSAPRHVTSIISDLLFLMLFLRDALFPVIQQDTEQQPPTVTPIDAERRKSIKGFQLHMDDYDDGAGRKLPNSK